MTRLSLYMINYRYLVSARASRKLLFTYFVYAELFLEALKRRRPTVVVGLRSTYTDPAVTRSRYHLTVY